MYRIVCDGETLYDPRVDGYHVGAPALSLAANAAGSASFIIYPGHARYSLPKKLASRVEIYDDSEVLFRGRILTEERGIMGDRRFTLEGLMACTNDSQVPPFNYPADWADDPDYNDAADTGNVVEFFLSWLLDNHNASVEANQQLNLGTVTVTDPNNYIARSSEDFRTTWDILREKLFESALGGYLVARYEPDGTYIDYLASFSTTNMQQAEFSINIADLTDLQDGSETYSAIIPLGAKDDDTGRRLTIADEPDGAITTDIIKDGLMLYSAAAVALYGKICAPPEESTWDDVTVGANLVARGVNFLASAVKMLRTINIAVADLKFAGASSYALRPYKNIIVTAEPQGASGTYAVTAIDYDLAEPGNSMLHLGATGRSLTGETVAAHQSVDEQIGSITSEVAGQTSAINTLSERVTEQSTSIIQDAQQLIITALENYTQTGDFEEFQQRVQTSLSVMSDQIVFNYRQTTDAINDLNGVVTLEHNELIKYIRFVEGDIVLGKEGNQITLKIEHDRISFRQDGVEVAYFADHKLFVTEGQFTTRAQFGKFAFVPGVGGNLSFKKVVD